MRSIIFAAALVAAADAAPEFFTTLWQREVKTVVGRQEKGVQQPIESPRLGSGTVQGCFKSPGDLVFNTTLQYNSIGECAEKLCREAGYPVGGTMGGNQCWCGETYPPKDDLVKDSNCDIGCTGYDQHACGGLEFWTIYNTGETLVVKHKESAKSSTSSGTPTSTAPAEKTQLVTETPSDSPDSGGGSNVAGIVAGVVVGVVVIASVIGGGFLYMRRKRNKEIEEEHRRNAAVNAFIGKPGSSAGSITDSRLDPVMAQRRLSDGSIADNQDYSRRILRVTNA